MPECIISNTSWKDDKIIRKFALKRDVIKVACDIEVDPCEFPHKVSEIYMYKSFVDETDFLTYIVGKIQSNETYFFLVYYDDPDRFYRWSWDDLEYPRYDMIVSLEFKPLIEEGVRRCSFLDAAIELGRLSDIHSDECERLHNTKNFLTDEENEKVDYHTRLDQEAVSTSRNFL
jgi:hypothetical protein